MSLDRWPFGELPGSWEAAETGLGGDILLLQTADAGWGQGLPSGQREEGKQGGRRWAGTVSLGPGRSSSLRAGPAMPGVWPVGEQGFSRASGPGLLALCPGRASSVGPAGGGTCAQGGTGGHLGPSLLGSLVPLVLGMLWSPAPLLRPRYPPRGSTSGSHGVFLLGYCWGMFVGCPHVAGITSGAAPVRAGPAACRMSRPCEVPSRVLVCSLELRCIGGP